MHKLDPHLVPAKNATSSSTTDRLDKSGDVTNGMTSQLSLVIHTSICCMDSAPTAVCLFCSNCF